MQAAHLQLRTSLAAGVLSGGLLALATAQVGLGPLAFAGLLPLLWAIDRGASASSAAAAGGAGGLVFFGCALSWVPIAGYGGALLVFLSGYAACLAGTWAAAAGLLRWLRARDRRLFLLGAPVVWAGAEFARSQGVLGYPWHQLGYALSDHPELIQLAAFGGVQALSLWIVAVNVWLLASRRGPRPALVAFALALLSPLALGWRASESPTGGEVRVAAVQPEVRKPGRGVRTLFDANLNRLVALSDEVMRESPDLLVWPESAYEAPVLSAGEPFLGSLALHYGRPLLTGSWRVTPGANGSFRNSAVLARADGRTQLAGDKVHPVPFYEASPATWLGRGIARLGLWPGSTGAARSAGLVRVRLDRPLDPGPGHRDLDLGVLICFDSSYPDLARDLRRRGAQLLVEISNEAQTGTWTAVQHARVSRLRAVETGLPLVRVGNAGPTEWVDARGRVRARIPPGSPASRAADLVLGGPPTPFVRFGASPAFAAALLPLLALSLRSFPRPARRTRHEACASPTPTRPGEEEIPPCLES